MSDITLAPGLPAPTDLPELPADAGDRWWDVAARLTGATELRASAPDMIAAGADADDVRVTVRAVDGQTVTLAHLLGSVDAVLREVPGSFGQLAAALRAVEVTA